MASNLIKSLVNNVEGGRPLGNSLLKEYGISSSLAHRYVESGWLDRLGRGVFMFHGDTLQRDATLRFLEGKVPGLHVASKTALAWHGYYQNLAFQETLILWGRATSNLPDWFLERFPARYSRSRIFGDAQPEPALVTLPDSGEGPTLSSPERALLEMLSEVDVHQPIDEAKAIMESMRQIRSQHLITLLDQCTRTKVVRLCLHWAEELKLPWAEKVIENQRGKTGSSRWVMRLSNGRSLILKP